MQFKCLNGLPSFRRCCEIARFKCNLPRSARNTRTKHQNCMLLLRIVQDLAAAAAAAAGTVCTTSLLYWTLSSVYSVVKLAVPDPLCRALHLQREEPPASLSRNNLRSLSLSPPSTSRRRLLLLKSIEMMRGEGGKVSHAMYACNALEREEEEEGGKIVHGSV